MMGRSMRPMELNADNRWDCVYIATISYMLLGLDISLSLLQHRLQLFDLLMTYSSSLFQLLIMTYQLIVKIFLF